MAASHGNSGPPKSASRQAPANDKYPRELAIRMLTRVLGERETLEDAFTTIHGELTPEARAWLLEVTSGTLRWKARLDSAIDAVAEKKKPTGWLRKVLLTGAYQLIGQDRTSPGAVVSECVNLVREIEGEAPAKFVNAVLRRLSEQAPQWKSQEFPSKASNERQAAWASLPEWFWKKLLADRGFQWAQAFAASALERPQIWIRARKPGWKPKFAAEPGPVAQSFSLADAAGIADREGLAEGEFMVQDISSQQLIAEVSAELKGALGSSSQLTALDLCAAPGGKAVGLAWNGFRVTATDRYERMALLRGTFERAAPEAKAVPRDEVARSAPYDLVWVDAPCSGTGIIRRHPDVRWLKTEKDIESLALIQEELLKEAWSLVKPGGYLAYSVCSVLKDEGERRLAAAIGDIKPTKTWLLAPHLSPGGDGFWCGLIKK